MYYSAIFIVFIHVHIRVYNFFSLFVSSPRLRAELSSKESDHQEALSGLQSKLTTEIGNLKKLLASSEANNTDLQRENNELQLKLTRARNKR